MRYVKDNSPISPECETQVEEILTEFIMADIADRDLRSAFESISYELPDYSQEQPQ